MHECVHVLLHVCVSMSTQTQHGHHSLLVRVCRVTCEQYCRSGGARMNVEIHDSLSVAEQYNVIT